MRNTGSIWTVHIRGGKSITVVARMRPFYIESVRSDITLFKGARQFLRAAGYHVVTDYHHMQFKWHIDFELVYGKHVTSQTSRLSLGLDLDGKITEFVR